MHLFCHAQAILQIVIIKIVCSVLRFVLHLRRDMPNFAVGQIIWIMEDFFANRRSIRRYADQPVSDALLDELFAKAFRASNTGNMQVYSVIVTRDAAQKAALAPLHFNQPMVRQAPVVLTFCADFHRFSEWCRLSDADPGYDNFLSFYTATVDAMLAAQNFAALAEQAGLGLCFLGTTNYNADGIIDVLGLPELVFPVTTVTLGYPAETPEQCERLPIEAIVHRERYAKQDVKALYAAKEALEANRAFVSENHKKTLAQVFTDIRYTRENNEHFSQALKAAMLRQGFKL